jgi:hypothetical protein
MPGFVSHIEPKVHRMGKGKKLAKLAIRRVIEAVQGYFYSILKIPLQQRFPILVGAV